VTSVQPNPTVPFIDQVADLVFQDVLPSGLVVASPNGLNLGSCAPASPVVTATPGSNTITLGNQPLNAGGGNTGGITLTNSSGAFDTCSFSLNVTAAATGTYVNTIATSFGGAYPLVSNDGNNGSATLNVAPSNAPPVAVDDNATVDEGTSGNVINVLTNDSDPDGDTLTISAATQGSHGSVVNNSTSVSYTPAPAFFGTDSFAYTINDGNGNTATATVHVIVNHINHPPHANDDSYSVNENTTLSVAAPGVLGNDTDADAGDTLQAVLVTTTSHGSLTLHADGSFTYVPNAGFACHDSFTYKANDGTADSNIATVSITVNDTQGPSISVSTTKTMLWPPSHDLVDVGLTFSSADNGCAGTATTSVAVFSTEDDVTQADGDESPDAKGALLLRAERDARNNGRVYLIRVTSTDASNNTTQKCAAVTVPHSMSAADVAAINNQAAAAVAACTANGMFVVGDGPVIGPKQ
jgi:VCBS repeat-containing protein